MPIYNSGCIQATLHSRAKCPAAMSTAQGAAVHSSCVIGGRLVKLLIQATGAAPAQPRSWHPPITGCEGSATNSPAAANAALPAWTSAPTALPQPCENSSKSCHMPAQANTQVSELGGGASGQLHIYIYIYKAGSAAPA